MAVFVAIVVALGSGTFAFTRLQRDAFNDTTTDFEQEMGALADLQQEILDAETPIAGILYELTRTGELEDQWQQFQQHGDRIGNHFVGLRDAVQPSDIQSLDRADRAWRSVTDGVTTGRGLWGTGEVSAALARGEDPFESTVWAPMTETRRALAALSVDSVAALRARAEQADHRQATLEPLLVAAVVVRWRSAPCPGGGCPSASFGPSSRFEPAQRGYATGTSPGAWTSAAPLAARSQSWQRR